MTLLALVPFLPLLAACILLALGLKASRSLTLLFGVGAPTLAAIAATSALWPVLQDHSAVISAPLWTWASLPGLNLSFGLRADALATVMTLVVAWVGLLICIYAAEYMKSQEGFTRFFGLLNLFLGMMLVLVLADSLLLLYVGWEGVGVCSYLLIGFWWREAANGTAARKAFFVTRIGDMGLVIGLYLLATTAGTLDLANLTTHAAQLPASTAHYAAFLLLIGAMSKSGQAPLHVWLPDAMAGPTPVSAMIHAATMVAAGVYLVARMSPVFVAGELLNFVAIIGAATLVIAGLAALAQTDIKRVLAYSTISQLGYMFVGLGAGAWDAAIFHFYTHAFFKALLFLAAGAIIAAAHHTQDVRRLGGLAKDARFLWVVFGAGVASLSALPVITAGFWSKDLILAQAWASPYAGPMLAWTGILGGLLTALYSFRLFFLIFHGERREGLVAEDHSGPAIKAPLAILATLAIIAGFIEHDFIGFLAASHPFDSASADAFSSTVMIASGLAALVGAGLAWVFWGRKGLFAAEPTGLVSWLRAGLGFDAAYEFVLQRPVLAITGTDRRDPIDVTVSGLAAVVRQFGVHTYSWQDSQLTTYLWLALLGAVALLTVGVI